VRLKSNLKTPGIRTFFAGYFQPFFAFLAAMRASLAAILFFVLCECRDVSVFELNVVPRFAM
jgi:hypothetical protein